jgi:hypothetical protein
VTPLLRFCDDRVKFPLQGLNCFSRLLYALDAENSGVRDTAVHIVEKLPDQYKEDRSLGDFYF